jgi:succinate dehydrogenase/fumarate reductase flavoprotein subunit
MSLWLSDAELVAATHLKQPARQARALEAMGVPFQRRPDGTLLVGRAAMETALAGGGRMGAKPAANGLNWSRQA